MQNEQIQVLVANLKRLLRRGATRQITNILEKTHMADISIIVRELSMDNRKKLLSLIKDPEKIGMLFSNLDENLFLELVQEIEFDKLVKVFESLPSDDAAFLLNLLDETLSDQILEKMKNEESTDVEQIMSYGEDTAGSVMVTDFIALKEDMMASQVIEALQSKYLDVEMPFYIYVVDEYGRLVGVSSLRQLVVVHPKKPLREFMATDVVTVKTHTNREDVAKLVSRYDYLAIPVVDDDNHLMGIVTVDDVIDILTDSATEDILKMAGVGEDYIETQTVLRGARIRLPWLFASFLGGVGAFFIISGFENSLSKFMGLAAFIPVIMGMGGNIGTQSSTIVVRGIATGRINLKDFRQVVTKELMVGLILGLTYGLFIGVVAKVAFSTDIQTWMLSVSVGLAVLCSMSVAALVGSVMPLIFERFRIDPAVATGPFVTTAMDIISIYCYFMIATVLLGL